MNFCIFIYCSVAIILFCYNICDYIDYKSKEYSDQAWCLEVKMSARNILLSIVLPVYIVIWIVDLIKDAI